MKVRTALRAVVKCGWRRR